MLANGDWSVPIELGCVAGGPSSPHATARRHAKAELRIDKPSLGKLLDVPASVISRFGFNTKDVRRGDYHLILRKL
jgi:hypothetical protein